VTGRELSRRFYEEQVRPRIEPGLGDIPHAASMIGDGSDVLGFDDDVSPDHDFGPRVQIVLPRGVDTTSALAALATLPGRYAGLPVFFASPSCYSGWAEGPPGRGHGLGVTSAAALFESRLGFDPADGITLTDWLTTPTQLVATVTDGPVFHDPANLLTERRAALSWYPEDVCRYVLAAGWLRVDQEQPFVGRAGGSGDDLGSAILTARLVRDLVRLAFLLERRWAPYNKWLGRAFAGLSIAAELSPTLSAAMSATNWREREHQLCAAAAVLVQATNGLGVAESIDPAPRQFFTRDIRVSPAGRLVAVLTAAVTDPPVRRLIDTLGGRSDQMPRLPGAIDQAMDSVDVLTNPLLRRTAGPTLGLPDTGCGLGHPRAGPPPQLPGKRSVPRGVGHDGGSR